MLDSRFRTNCNIAIIILHAKALLVLPRDTTRDPKALPAEGVASTQIIPDSVFLSGKINENIPPSPLAKTSLSSYFYYFINLNVSQAEQNGSGASGEKLALSRKKDVDAPRSLHLPLPATHAGRRVDSFMAKEEDAPSLPLMGWQIAGKKFALSRRLRPRDREEEGSGNSKQDGRARRIR
ncbi:hypothetical protein KM043_016835 [Ampulex compressa]|nr:hypothetical protein KM043_016835 [Ampulex compressa]